MSGGNNGSKIQVERELLVRVRRTLQRVKRADLNSLRVIAQTHSEADRQIGEIDKLLRQATDTTAR